MKGLLATLITVSGVVLITTSVSAQETTLLSQSQSLDNIKPVEFNGDMKTLMFDEDGNLIGINPGSGGSSPWTGYIQPDINYVINGEGKGNKPEGSTMQLTPEQKTELNNSSSPGSAVLIRF